MESKLQKISKCLKLFTGFLEVFCIFAMSFSFYFVDAVLLENGHFCPKNQTLDIVIEDQVSPYLKICPEEFLTSQQNQISYLTMAPIICMGLLSYTMGILVDRFNISFTRILISLAYLSGYLSLAFINFDNDHYLPYIAILLISLGNGTMIIHSFNFLPRIYEKYENWIRSVINGIVIGSAWFYWAITRYFLGNQIRFEKLDYFWNLKNFSRILTLVCWGLFSLRTLIWFRHEGARSASKYGSKESSTCNLKYLIGYTAATETNSLTSQFRYFKFWTHVLHMALSNLPYYCFYGYINQFLTEKGFDNDQINEILEVGA